MHLIHKDLTKFDTLNDHEDVTRQNRVEAHIKNQQQYTYPVVPVDTASSPADRDTSFAQSQGVMDYNDKVRQWNDTSFYSQHSSSPAPVTSLMSNDQHHQNQKRRPSTSHAQHHSYRKGRKKLWNKYQRQKYKPTHRKPSAKQKQKEHHDIQPKKKLGLHLLEKFTSPNIEIDHITVAHRPTPRVGLFNKGKTSARGKGVEDLVFSEASFFGRGSPQQYPSPSMIAKTSIINDGNTEKINAESFSRPSLLSSSSPLEDKQPLNEQESCSTDGIYDFFESTKRKSDETMKQPTLPTIHTQHLQDTVAHTTKSSSYYQRFSHSPVQSPQKAVLIEPDPLPYDNGQHNALYGSSEYQDFATGGRAPFGNQQYHQLPHYTSGTTPLDSPAAKSIKEGSYNYATLSYDGRLSEHSENSNRNSGILYGSIGSETLHAWDSTSMINDPQHFRNKRSYIDTHWQPSHLENIDPSLQPLAKRGIFKLSGGPIPFRPNTTITSKRRPLYADTMRSEHVLPRIPPMKPIYNIADPMTSTSTTLCGLRDALGHDSNIISISSGSGCSNGKDDQQQQHKNRIGRTYRWQPNYQLNPATQQRNFYYDQQQQRLSSHQQSIPLTSDIFHDDDSLTPPPPPPPPQIPTFTTRSHTIYPIH